MLSNYNIKYSTLDVRLSEWCCSLHNGCGYTCLTPIPRFTLREKVTLGAAVYQWCGFKSRRGKNKNLTALKSNSNTVWFNFQTYIIFSINLVSLVTFRSSGTYILYGCHLFLDVCIIYFISCDCIVNNSSLSYPIY